MSPEYTPGDRESSQGPLSELPQLSSISEANALLSGLFGFLAPRIRPKNKGKELEVFLPLRHGDDEQAYIGLMQAVAQQLARRGITSSTELRTISHLKGKKNVIVGHAFDVAFSQPSGE